MPDDTGNSPLEDIVPASARRKVYATFALLGVLLGAIQVGFAAVATGDQPAWLTASLAVYAFLGGALGLTARANTSS